MPSEKKPSSKKTRKIKIRTRIKNNNNNNSNDDDYTSDPELIAQQKMLLDFVRNQAIEQMEWADDSKYGTPEEQMQVVHVGYRYLSTFGLEGNEISKSWYEMGPRNWRRLSSWRA